MEDEVYISYVSDNRKMAHRLAEELRAFGLVVWLDRERTSQAGGWRAPIRHAITSRGAFVLCFSREYQEREKTYANPELALAIDELRGRATGRQWFVPVLLNDCQIPDVDIGGGDTLRSLRWLRLHEDWNQGVGQIVAVVDPTAAEFHDLEAQLGSPSELERSMAADGLAKLLDKVRALNIQAAHSDESKQVRLADRLGKLGSLMRRAESRLTALVQDDPSETVRAATTAALGTITEAIAEAVASLLGIMRGGEYYASMFAAAGLPKLGQRAVAALVEARTFTDYGVAHHAHQAFSKIDDPAAVPDLMREVRAGSRWAIEGLGNIGEASAPVVSALLEQMNHPDNSTQWTAIEALGRVGDPGVVPAIAAKLRAANGRTRAEAATALGRISGPAAVQHLLPALADPKDMVRAWAIKALDWSQFPGDAPSQLAELLRDSDTVVRMYAAEQLATLADPRAVSMLISLLDDGEPSVERAAARALGACRAEAAVPALAKKVTHEKAWVQDAMEKALEDIGTPEALHALAAASATRAEG